MSTGKVVAISFIVSAITSAGMYFALSRLTVEEGEAVEEQLAGTEVPLLTGMRPEQARKLLRASELLLIVTGREESTEVGEGLIVSQSPLEGSVVKPGSEVDVVVSKGLPSAPIPEVVGLNLPEAVEQLKQLELVVDASKRVIDENVPKDQVISSDPAAGQPAVSGSTVKLVVSDGGPRIEVPRLIRARIEGAKRLIRKSGFKVGEVTFRDDPEAPGGTVLRQMPKAGTMAEQGSKVDIWVNTFE
jgi:serine/threonine-protein kinase